ncbi:Adenine phosphoribosyltransferase [Erysiphe necator]|uniref:adenine phosphoribosyltransferase n=1 Tax=Uncinula necator TaxID=52586 RepID=A0A0B1P634_UNCNE|nr:Adenine phosphoribosyltransferase [Erysiphe necator]KHJ34157.1 putative adenine phosphoribosyltransferase [Erysiphe necator]
MSEVLSPDATKPQNSKASPLDNAASRFDPSTSTSSATELARAKVFLQAALKKFHNFPQPGIVFVDILPLFANPDLHLSLIRALELQTLELLNGTRPDVIVGLDARGFLFGPSLALRLGAGFAPVRKRNKLPGPTVETAYVKEYGSDYFQMQVDAIKKGQSVLIVDDIIATGGSAKAAGELVEKLNGNLLGYLFILEIDSLNGRDGLNKPNFVLL